MQARIDNDDDDDDDDGGGDCIGNTLGKLLRVLSRIREFFVETLNKKFTEFFNVRIFREILHYSLLVRILQSSNFMYYYMKLLALLCYLPLPFVDQIKCTVVEIDR